MFPPYGIENNVNTQNNIVYKHLLDDNEKCISVAEQCNNLQWITL